MPYPLLATWTPIEVWATSGDTLIGKAEDFLMITKRRSCFQVRYAAVVSGPFRSCLFILLLTVVGLAIGNTAKAATTNAVLSRPGSRFAVADFDGDVRPDVARIEIGAINSTYENYSVQFDLSSSGRKSIQLFAPQGGLVIEARDVNRDNAVDLVLTTAWLRQPVAVLINDGHGNFSRVEPNEFPGAFNQPRHKLSAPVETQWDSISTPPSKIAVNIEPCGPLHSRPPTELVFAPSTNFFLSSFPASLFGRAPPAAPSRV